MNTNLNMQTMPIDRLKPAKYNPGKDLKPGNPAYEKIKRSLHDFGYVDPIVWNEVTGNIVGGHQRFKVLKAEGATEVDCVVVHITARVRSVVFEDVGSGGKLVCQVQASGRDEYGRSGSQTPGGRSMD